MSRPDLIRTVKRLRKGRDSHESIKQKLQDDLTAAQGQIADLTQKTATLAAVEANAAALTKANEAMAAEKAALEAKIEDLAKALAEAKANAAAESVAKTKLQDELTAKTQEAEAAKSASLAAQKRIDELASQLAAANADNAQLKGQVAELRDAKASAATSSTALAKAKEEADALVAKLQAAEKTIAELQDKSKSQASAIAKLEAGEKAFDERLGEAKELAEKHSTDLAKTKAELVERERKITKLEKMIEQTDAYEIDDLATKLNAATKGLEKAEGQVSELQKSLLARTEAEKRLIAERNSRLEAERQTAIAKRAREEQLHKYLTDAADANQAKDFERALANLRKVLEMDPDNQQAITHIGLIEADLGNDDEAERMLDKAYAMDPTNQDVLLRLGFVRLRQEKALAAAGTLLLGATAAPKVADFHHYAGIACRSLGWPVASEMELKRAFELNPKNADTAYNLAVLLATLDEPLTDEAREWYKKALALGAKPNPGLDRYFQEN
jgi:Tfp pilus assembly protein PilF